MVTLPEGLTQQEVPLVKQLTQSAHRDHAAFYAPGHKRGQGLSVYMEQLLGDRHPLKADLPELPELDNLFAPEGVIQSAQGLAAAAFGASQTWFLANGSTCGIEAAILATCGPGDRLLLPRNVHRSAISGLILSGAMPIFVEPDYDPDWDMAHGVAVGAIAQALDTYRDIKAILIVSPTYYGTCADVVAIAQLAHQHHIPLIVDEAHGPHFGFHPDLPQSALSAGADLVVQSTHKVLSAITQASMLHLGCGGQPDGLYRVQPQRISAALQLVQSSSPNYLLLASLDAARQQMATEGDRLMQQTLDLADDARTQLSQIPGIRVFDATAHWHRPGIADGDRTRLTVAVSDLGLTGFDADDSLHTQLGVTAELPTQKHLTFIISLGNTRDDIDRLVQGFQQLAGQEGRRQKAEKAEGRRQKAEKTIIPNSELKTQNSDLKTQTSKLKTQTSDLKTQTSKLKTQNSDLKTQNSDLKTQTSKLKPQTSDLKTQNSDLKTQNSDLKTQNSDLKTQTSKLKTQNSDLKTQNSKLKTQNSKLFHVPMISPRDAFFAPIKRVAIAQSIGHISGELICPYPPG
ncbi:MAG: aminotransferase class I/II-fold pyridoxal phosphate-dependent enzyme, partial [Leptolyngbyaceae cyanobacterium]